MVFATYCQLIQQKHTEKVRCNMYMNWKIEYCEQFPKLVNRFSRILIKFLEIL